MNEPFSLVGKRVTVLGWARSGRPAAALARSLGARVFVSDAKPFAGFDDAARAEVEPFEHEFGGHTARALEADIVLLSPGIKRSLPLLGGYRGRIWSEIELACRVIPSRIVAVTGTNGKTTTTTLIGEILSTAYRGGKVHVAGNIGRAVSGVALSARENDICVIEISSFQLENIEDFRPDVAVYLNLRSDHLDWYPAIAEYRAAKGRIFANMRSQDAAILNLDDAVCRELAAELTGPRVVTVAATGRADYTLTADYTPAMLEAVKSPENLLSAVAACELCGLTRADILPVLRSFRGLPHRIEKVGELRGVSFWNDSKATNVSAVEAALKFVPPPVILVMGGKDKGEDYTALRPLVAGKCRKVIAYGDAALRIAQTLDADIEPRFDDAVRAAWREATPGAAILLSPACSSYDQFKDYAARGERFRAVYLALRDEERRP